MEYNGTILLVEDNLALNAANSNALKIFNYNVYSAVTLAEARSWLALNKADIILLDVMLPDGDGIDFCAEIRSAPIETTAHILFLTAKSEHADRVRGLTNGGDDYIAKPFHPEELLARVEAAIRRISMNRLNLNEAQSIVNVEENIQAFAAHHGFTPREAEVLTMLCQGASSTDIAQELLLKEVTLYAYFSHMYKKSGTGNRTELVLRASSFQDNNDWS